MGRSRILSALWFKAPQQLKWKSASSSGSLHSLSNHAIRINTKSGISKSNRIELSYFDHHQVFGIQNSSMSQDGLELVIEGSLDTLISLIRKNQHLEICETQDVESSDKFTGFGELSFVPKALPELSWDDLNTSCSFLGRTFDYPLLITGMTGGVARGAEINQRLGRLAESMNIPMGVGSQRMALDDPGLAHLFQVKQWAPNVFLMGNIGGAQLLSSKATELCQRAVDMIDADALAIHLNVLQECVQPEGTPNFKGLLKRIETVCVSLSVPVVIKEVGSGMDKVTAQQLIDAGVASIDCSGRGGTSWGYIEGLRSTDEDIQQLGACFRNWGIPTAYSLASLRKEFPDFPITCTGGIRDGLTVAKAVALGANFVGVGLPFLKAALKGDEELKRTFSFFARSLKVTMFATGSKTLSELKTKLTLSHPLRGEFESYVSDLSNAMNSK